MASYASFQYSWVLYHDYDRPGAEMLSASHYGRVKWINIPEEAESGVQRACVWADSTGRSECTNAEGFMRRLHLSFRHTFVFHRCMRKYWLLIRASFLAQEQHIDSISACGRCLCLSCVGDKLCNTVVLLQHSRRAGGRAGWGRSFAWSHLGADLQAVCDRELRCLLRMRSAQLEGCCLVNSSGKAPQAGRPPSCVMKLTNLGPLIAQLLCWFDLKIWFALVWRIFLLTLCTRMQNHARLSPRNYANLMPHSPLLFPNSVHIFISVLNEGAATCFILNKRRLYLFLIWGSLGGWWCRLCRDHGGGSCMGIFRP